MNNTELWFALTVQRKKYAVSVNKMMDKFQYRVEVSCVALSRQIWPFIDPANLMLCFHASLLQHLFTCELDGSELRGVADCVERLKLLEEMGRVWGQSMLLVVHGPKLLLMDIETKVYDTDELKFKSDGNILFKDDNDPPPRKGSPNNYMKKKIDVSRIL